MIEDSLLGLGAAGFHRISYTDWGDPAAERVVLCVHGLTRNGRDFDRLAERLAENGARVVCPDIVGRGPSDWLPIPALSFCISEIIPSSTMTLPSPSWEIPTRRTLVIGDLLSRQNV